jgi:hypothetical protein
MFFTSHEYVVKVTFKKISVPIVLNAWEDE